MKAILFSLIISTGLQGQTVVEDGHKPVALKQIQVKGSRLPNAVVIQLTGLSAGQTVDEAKVRQALGRANSTGLFKNIAYTYESEPSSEEVTMVLEVKDQMPLVPGKIKIQGVDEEAAWKYLESANPVFTRELPSTEACLRMYERFLTKYMATLGRTDTIGSELTGSADHVKGVVFLPVKLRTLKR